MNSPACVLDEKDWCERHRRFHHGGLKRHALDPGVTGQRYRRKWDMEEKGLLPRPVPSGGVPLRVLSDRELRLCAHNAGKVRGDGGKPKLQYGET